MKSPIASAVLAIGITAVSAAAQDVPPTEMDGADLPCEYDTEDPPKIVVGTHSGGIINPWICVARTICDSPFSSNKIYQTTLCTAQNAACPSASDCLKDDGIFWEFADFPGRRSLPPPLVIR